MKAAQGAIPGAAIGFVMAYVLHLRVNPLQLLLVLVFAGLVTFGSTVRWMIRGGH